MSNNGIRTRVYNRLREIRKQDEEATEATFKISDIEGLYLATSPSQDIFLNNLQMLTDRQDAARRRQTDIINRLLENIEEKKARIAELEALETSKGDD